MYQRRAVSTRWCVFGVSLFGAPQLGAPVEGFVKKKKMVVALVHFAKGC